MQNSMNLNPMTGRVFAYHGLRVIISAGRCRFEKAHENRVETIWEGTLPVVLGCVSNDTLARFVMTYENAFGPGLRFILTLTPMRRE